MDSINLFYDFLKQQNIPFIRNSSSTIEKIIDENFDKLNESDLKALVARTLQVRDDNIKKNSTDSALFGAWSEIIDSIRISTLKRREVASTNIQKMIEFSNDDNPQNLIRFLRLLHKNGLIDKTFKDLLESSRQAYENHQQIDVGNRENIIAFYQFASGIITRLEDQISSSSGSYGKESSGSTVHINAAVNTAIVANIQTTTDRGIDQKRNEARSDSNIPSIQSSESNNEEFTDPNFTEEDLKCAGDKLNELMSLSRMDAKVLKDSMISYLKTDGTDSRPVKALQRVLSDNIAASEALGYNNKVKLFTFLQTTLHDYLIYTIPTPHEKDEAFSPDLTTGLSAIPQSSHVPQFIDNDTTVCSSETPLLIHAPDSASAAIIGSDIKFIDGSSLSAHLLSQYSGLRNNRKKLDKRMARERAREAIDKLSAQLEKHHWAICDHFIDDSLVRRVRSEIDCFTSYYEQSEIWIGKVAEIGAQITVPSVRGDSVLWVCGGHSEGQVAPESMSSRLVKSKHEVEPCRLDVKASAPIKKFIALKDLILACDKLILEELKPRVTALHGLYDRSDAMMAIYSGDGARFAKHIDNTTNDGRRLTVLMYLNHGWTVVNGGALRLSLPSLPSRGIATETSTLSLSLESSVVLDVLPLSGRIAMFYSAEMPHEVMPTYDADRHAITIWYYDSSERHNTVAQAQTSGRSRPAAKATVEQQREVKHFMTELVSGGVSDTHLNQDSLTENITPEYLAYLYQRVQQLSPEALAIVASITGAESAEIFKQGFSMLTPLDLSSMRQLFKRMGLN